MENKKKINIESPFSVQKTGDGFLFLEGRQWMSFLGKRSIFCWD
jgi:hypothetical protein